MLLDLELEPKKIDGITESTWMFKITTYPNGKQFISKPWQIGSNKKDFAKKKTAKKERESEIQSIEEY